MRWIEHKNLMPGDVFMMALYGDIYRLEKVVSPPGRWEGGPPTMELEVKVLFSEDGDRPGRKFTHTVNAEFFCNYLRPGVKDQELIRINMSRGD